MEECGRPTKAGTPCKLRSTYLYMPCTVHTTEEDKTVLLPHLEKAYALGKAAGIREVKSEAWREVDTEKRRLAALVEEDARQLHRNYREKTSEGQVVEVKGYAFVWDGDEPLRVGDLVKVPGGEWSPGGWEGKVTALGSTYFGGLRKIISKVD